MTEKSEINPILQIIAESTELSPRVVAQAAARVIGQVKAQLLMAALLSKPESGEIGGISAEQVMALQEQIRSLRQEFTQFAEADDTAQKPTGGQTSILSQLALCDKYNPAQAARIIGETIEEIDLYVKISGVPTGLTPSGDITAERTAALEAQIDALQQRFDYFAETGEYLGEQES